MAASVAHAQDADADASGSESEDAAIVVTGTLLRGVAPVGTNVIGVTEEEVIATGAASANDLLASIPQVGNFGTIPAGVGNFGNPIVRPNIRNLGASGGSTTLVLMNGHRMVGAGILQTSFDPSVIPPDVIKRVDVIPDGGSSIYGSDAIGGVINFITRDRYDGIGVNARYGFAKDYQTVDASIIAGKDWGSGSVFISYAYAWHDDLIGLDRDYATADQAARGGGDFRSTACSLANITVGTTTYALPGRAPGTLNRCDQTDYAAIYPREERHSVFCRPDPGTQRQRLFQSFGLLVEARHGASHGAEQPERDDHRAQSLLSADRSRDVAQCRFCLRRCVRPGQCQPVELHLVRRHPQLRIRAGRRLAIARARQFRAQRK
ncbi:TonB-dependent receptor plug domain-containing protein [Sphingopyxis sp. PET50]|uniref:TonB-dependent receptor plug domain-containing protein n=1 Tax=Sphingopyxis sp. PET50 TaxID=2976533 RepID=UPI0021AFDF7C|nr:TonB-dependent receptor plug domain-containing protein [Sphingopyxis sp. PET50]